MKHFILFCLVSAISYASHLEFPDDFLFGIASSAYQVEGAWNESGKGESIWDKFTHDQSHKIIDHSNADFACNSYHKIKEDVQLLKNLGVHFYRFSLSWARILPTGYINKINPDGVRYYNELINELIKNKIMPVVTLYHWDLPQSLQEIGGWPNPFLVDYFADYARVAFQKFGDRVKLWITLNEPYHICQEGYTLGKKAPGFKSNGFANYMCSYTLLLAHAKVYHIYDKEFRHTQEGRVGITADTHWFEPRSKSSEDVYASEMALQASFGWFMHPIYSWEGDFPVLMKERIANISAEQSLRRSRLPKFTPEEIEYIRGSADFMGLNHYSTFLVRHSHAKDTSKLYSNADMGLSLEHHPGGDKTPTPWIRIVPWGLRKLLNWIKREYDNPVLYIFESGMGDTEEILNDKHRVRYMKGYLNAILEAIYKDGCDVRGYTAWSLMDNFEWFRGYTLKFRLHHVDFTDPQRKRTPKASALYYKQVISTRRTGHEYEPVPELRRSNESHCLKSIGILYYVICLFYIVRL